MPFRIPEDLPAAAHPRGAPSFVRRRTADLRKSVRSGMTLLVDTVERVSDSLEGPGQSWST